MLSVLTNDAHMNAADFSKSRCKCCSDRCLLIYRICFFIPCFLIASLNTYGDWRGSIYFESEWGFIMSTLSVLCSLLAHFTKYCQCAALLTSEISMGFNIVITIIFWGILVPQIYQMIIHPPSPPPPAPECAYTNFLKFQCSVWWLFFELAFVHSAPMINSVIELLSTKMVFLR